MRMLITMTCWTAAYVLTGLLLGLFFTYRKKFHIERAQPGRNTFWCGNDCWCTSFEDEVGTAICLSFLLWPLNLFVAYVVDPVARILLVLIKKLAHNSLYDRIENLAIKRAAKLYKREAALKMEKERMAQEKAAREAAAMALKAEADVRAERQDRLLAQADEFLKKAGNYDDIK